MGTHLAGTTGTTWQALQALQALPGRHYRHYRRDAGQSGPWGPSFHCALLLPFAPERRLGLGGRGFIRIASRCCSFCSGIASRCCSRLQCGGRTAAVGWLQWEQRVTSVGLGVPLALTAAVGASLYSRSTACFSFIACLSFKQAPPACPSLTAAVGASLYSRSTACLSFRAQPAQYTKKQLMRSCATRAPRMSRFSCAGQRAAGAARSRG